MLEWIVLGCFALMVILLCLDYLVVDKSKGEK